MIRTSAALALFPTVANVKEESRYISFLENPNLFSGFCCIWGACELTGNGLISEQRRLILSYDAFNLKFGAKAII